MHLRHWQLFIKGMAVAFLAYWLHLGTQVNDWLGSDGFHVVSPASLVFRPLPEPMPSCLWWMVLLGTALMFFRRTLPVGCVLAGGGFFYATMTDLESAGALNMNFLFGFAVIFWSSGLPSDPSLTLSAWPVYLIRIYLVVVYFGSGWRKAVFGDWLTNPDALIHCMTGFYATDFTRYLFLILPPLAWTFMQYGVIVFELGAPLLLLAPALRKWGILMGCLLHLGIALLMRDLVYFSLQMLAFYIPFLIPVTDSPPESRKSPQEGI